MLEFVTCPHCGKSIRSNAETCYKCQRPVGIPQTSPLIGSEKNRTERSDLSNDSFDSREGHAEISDEDDFDYDEFVKREFGGKRDIPRIYVFAAWALILAFLLPLFYGIWSLIQR